MSQVQKLLQIISAHSTFLLDPARLNCSTTSEFERKDAPPRCWASVSWVGLDVASTLEAPISGSSVSLIGDWGMMIWALELLVWCCNG